MIDCHVHVGFGGGIDATPAQLVASMDAAGVTEALVIAGDLFACPTDRLLKEVEPFKDRLHVVASAHVDSKAWSVARLDDLLEEGLVHGVKVYTGYEHVFPYDARFHGLFEALAFRKRPVVFHCGDTFKVVKSAKLKYAHPLGVDEVAVDFPDLKVVIAHMGWPWHVDAAEVAAKNENVYLDCSGFVYGTFTKDDVAKFRKVVSEVYDIVGKEKLLFGSDWPISDQDSYARIAGGIADDSATRRVFGLEAPAS